MQGLWWIGSNLQVVIHTLRPHFVAPSPYAQNSAFSWQIEECGKGSLYFHLSYCIGKNSSHAATLDAKWALEHPLRLSRYLWATTMKKDHGFWWPQHWLPSPGHQIYNLRELQEGAVGYLSSRCITSSCPHLPMPGLHHTLFYLPFEGRVMPINLTLLRAKWTLIS